MKNKINQLNQEVKDKQDQIKTNIQNMEKDKILLS